MCPNSHEKFTKSVNTGMSNLESVRILLKITRPSSRKSYLVIIGPNPQAKLTKTKLSQVVFDSNIAQNHSSSP